MSIPRGDCDCCGRLVERLTEIEEAYWVCDICQGAAHRCPLDDDMARQAAYGQWVERQRAIERD